MEEERRTERERGAIGQEGHTSGLCDDTYYTKYLFNVHTMGEMEMERGGKDESNVRIICI